MLWSYLRVVKTPSPKAFDCIVMVEICISSAATPMTTRRSAINRRIGTWFFCHHLIILSAGKALTAELSRQSASLFLV
jgi:hypothetical protein